MLTLYAYDEDAERRGIPAGHNQDACMSVAFSRRRFVNIPGRTYAEELEILEDFLDSEWTIDRRAKEMARRTYRGSITNWLKAFNYQGPAHAYCRFRSEALRQAGDELLRLHRIEAEWR